MELIFERLLKLPIEKDTGSIVVLSGGAGAGKSYSIKNFTNVTDFSTTINYDNFKPLILSSDKLKKGFYDWLKLNHPNGLVNELDSYQDLSKDFLANDEFSKLVHDYVVDKNLFGRKLGNIMAGGSKPNIVIDGTLRYIPFIEKKLDRLYDNGYSEDKTHLIFIFTSLETNLERNSKRSRKEDAFFVSKSYFEVLDNIIMFIRDKKLPSNMTGSFTVIVNNSNTDNSNLKYYTLMKDGKWSEEKIRQFYSEQKIVDKTDRNDASNRAEITESYENLPYISFDYFGSTYHIVQKKDSSFIVANANKSTVVDSLVEGFNNLFSESKTLNDIEVNIKSIKFIKNIKGQQL